MKESSPAERRGEFIKFFTLTTAAGLCKDRDVKDHSTGQNTFLFETAFFFKIHQKQALQVLQSQRI